MPGPPSTEDWINVAMLTVEQDRDDASPHGNDQLWNPQRRDRHRARGAGGRRPRPGGRGGRNRRRARGSRGHRAKTRGKHPGRANCCDRPDRRCAPAAGHRRPAQHVQLDPERSDQFVRKLAGLGRFHDPGRRRERCRPLRRHHGVRRRGWRRRRHQHGRTDLAVRHRPRGDPARSARYVVRGQHDGRCRERGHQAADRRIRRRRAARLRRLRPHRGERVPELPDHRQPRRQDQRAQVHARRLHDEHDRWRFVR